MEFLNWRLIEGANKIIVFQLEGYVFGFLIYSNTSYLTSGSWFKEVECLLPKKKEVECKHKGDKIEFKSI